MLVSLQLQQGGVVVQINMSVHGCHNQCGIAEQFCKCTLRGREKAKYKNLTAGHQSCPVQ